MSEHLVKAKAALEVAQENEGPMRYLLLTIAQVQATVSIAESLAAHAPEVKDEPKDDGIGQYL